MYDGSDVTAGIADPFKCGLARGSGGAPEWRPFPHGHIQPWGLPIRRKPRKDRSRRIFFEREQKLLHRHAAPELFEELLFDGIPDEPQESSSGGLSTLGAILFRSDAAEQEKLVPGSGAGNIEQAP